MYLCFCIVLTQQTNFFLLYSVVNTRKTCLELKNIVKYKKLSVAKILSTKRLPTANITMTHNNKNQYVTSNNLIQDAYK